MTQYKSFQEYFQSVSTESFIDDYNRSIEQLLTIPAKELAKDGWTIPPFINWYKITSLEPIATNQDQIKNAWVKLYIESGEEILKEIVESSPEAWRDLLHECVKSYFDERYRICIPALMSAFEGILAFKVFKGLPTKKVRYFEPLNTQIITNHFTGVDIILAISIREYIAELFKPHTFTGEEPSRVNRHWVAHGRLSLPSNKIIVIKLFNAIATLNYLKDTCFEFGLNDKPAL